ncbi:hypothetical protein [Streptomyces sp. NPDC059949]|uniref:hypothetical protein n=1 Tax=Streptomyces sp. NPDC059949 TaxID=3347013 RepID=UPI00365A8464
MNAGLPVLRVGVRARPRTSAATPTGRPAPAAGTWPPRAFAVRLRDGSGAVS